ncbi:MAG: J domain-containing protein [Acidobacteriota bacterium]|nr:J domain-containing protein [Acidobacteriota bacterium]
MVEPVAVDARGFFDFIGGAPFAAVLVSVHPLHTFSRPLSERLAAAHPDVSVGIIDFRNLILAGGPALSTIHRGLLRCGAPDALGVLPGYCLFQRGEMIAWEAGLPTFADVEAMATSAWLGAVVSGVTRDLRYLGRSLQLAADEVTADRIAERFHHAIAGGGPAAQPAPDREGDIVWAYQVLGVTPDATDREIRAAWRQRRKHVHPDLVSGDPSEFARRSNVSVEMNRAKDIIERHRAELAAH